MTRTVTAATAREELDAATAALARGGVETPRADAEWLLADVLGVGRAALGLALDAPLAAEAARRYGAAVCRRAAREPLQQILGWEAFRGIRLRVTPEVLVPRPETEILVDVALALVGNPPRPRSLRVVDVGTGSGAIACAIAAERAARVLAIDRSPAAAAVARDNVRALALESRVSVVVGDLLDPVAVRADLIVSNPPYLTTAMLRALPPEVARHEPRGAVDGGADGLDVIRPLVAAAPARLAPGGAIALETAGGPQAARVAGLLREAGFVEVVVRADLVGVQRFVTGRML